MQSELEAAGLEPVREYRFDPGRKWRFDFAFVRDRVGVEIEGGAWVRGRHTRGAGFARDCQKYTRAAVLGWRVLRFTSGQVTSGEALAVIREALSCSLLG